jgi:hypothetical protein
LTDIHAPNATGKARDKTGKLKILWHNKTIYKMRFVNNHLVRAERMAKTIGYGDGVLKMG